MSDKKGVFVGSTLEPETAAWLDKIKEESHQTSRSAMIRVILSHYEELMEMGVILAPGITDRSVKEMFKKNRD